MSIDNINQAYRRHIIVDNITRCIYIQVMEDLKGYPKEREYNDIAVNGQWYKYVPGDMIQKLHDAVSNGYQVKAFKCMGAEAEEYRVLQVVEVKKKSIFHL